MFLDFAFAILTSIVAKTYFDISIISTIYFGILFSILPDIDFVIYKIFGIHQDKGYKHRDLFHCPLLYLPIGFVILFIFSKTLAIIFLVISTLHFLHDSIAYGRGIKWLFPFSKNSFAFVYLYSRVVKVGLWQWAFIFNNKNLDEWDQRKTYTSANIVISGYD
ncbi:metal-dependent hydrolase [Patescibacteria group bacterium]|nr:metal-dependent hydrolase [Patescibacteria group bacterium]MBU1663466.1 metal-dependent hydrolase [Patescibacteria group bacterium]MBU1934101.1 metal-dependent hydrolase [Patescibacteria group bacterium]MBU2007746.1 metal-dependent hydrolase [Patescibacteria group bacterium]MBU2233871.1 metal-dependent hydrolase [Patescibacteria group bacterium]